MIHPDPLVHRMIYDRHFSPYELYEMGMLREDEYPRMTMLARALNCITRRRVPPYFYAGGI